ncbi:prepilin-type N-terminal cleavage/methylation domain-containing protein [Exiguobacterium algae]|uniref:prepilin-type N-terminal cleavage/methylation domain-containing protein n=1 Tax=Exiguobacterium algae TaxID=2751250 RepID=UPI001BE646ED|nr:prepilin-type N-terminal cleavage/methylation domain-containing protein [Exiguobacterium algae]
MLEKMKMIWQDAKQLKDERGLTLVELLVVVVILGIIAAIAVVAIGGIIENSKKDAMVADAKQMVSAAKLYTASNPVEDPTILDFKSVTNTAASGSGTSAVLATVGTQSYISELTDPFGGSAYSTATVKVTENSGNYEYEVNLAGTDYKFADKASSSLKKDNLDKVTN